MAEEDHPGRLDAGTAQRYPASVAWELTFKTDEAGQSAEEFIGLDRQYTGSAPFVRRRA